MPTRHRIVGFLNAVAIGWAVVLLPESSTTAAETFRLPDTGQERCYTRSGKRIPCGLTGQDGAYTINPLTYVDEGEGKVTDVNTGLQWQRLDDGEVYNWYEATGNYHADYNPAGRDVCGDLILGGASDWRLPTPKELLSLVHYGVFDPSIDTCAFPSAGSEYWSSCRSANAVEEDLAWWVDFSYGSLRVGLTYFLFPVRCVRGAEEWSVEPFVDHKDGTVADTRTNLVWQQGETSARSWRSAISSCERLRLGGMSDWRLPNLKELASLVDFLRSGSAIDTSLFPDAHLTNYWSSTTLAPSPQQAWTVDFSSGAVDYDIKDLRLHGRCVRGGQ